MSEDRAASSRIDTTRPHPARAYDYYLGGKDNFAADRELAQRTLQVWPTVRVFARENRKFLGRAVRYLAAEAGVRQFLDIGTGIPTSPNTYEIAQAAAPESRVVYVDNDPIVLAHARALIAGDPRGRTAYIEADLRDPHGIIDHPVTRELLDFTRPIGLLLVAVLHFVPDDWRPREIIATLLDPLPSGSYLVASHITAEHDPDSIAAAADAYRRAGLPAQARTAEEFEDLVFLGQGLVPVEPGVVSVAEWRAEQSAVKPTPAEVSCYGGIGRKS